MPTNNKLAEAERRMAALEADIEAQRRDLAASRTDDNPDHEQPAAALATWEDGRREALRRYPRRAETSESAAAARGRAEAHRRMGRRA